MGINAPSSYEIPFAKAVFDAHHDFRSRVKIAGLAILDVVGTVVAYGDPMASVVLGADAQTLELLANAPKQKIDELTMSGVAIFSLRMQGPQFANALKNHDANGSLKLLLKSFSAPLPVASLNNGSFGEPLVSGLPDIHVANAVYDAHPDVRRKIEIANRAVLDAVRAGVAYGDPMVTAVFGVDTQALEMLANASRSMLNDIAMTGVAMFALRSPDGLLAEVLSNNDADACLKVLLKAFPDSSST